MLRTVITPVTTQVHLSIPKEYLGKKVEILLFSVDEPVKEHPVKKNTMPAADMAADNAWLKLSEETLSAIWETPENEIWDEYYLKQNEKGNV